MAPSVRFPVVKTYFQIQVRDLERAKKWYEDVFQLDTMFMAPEAGWGEMQLHGGDPKLGLNLTDKTVNWGKLMFEVEDITEAKEYMEKKGIKTTELTTIPGMVTYFDIQDSEGNSIQIVAVPK